MTEPEDENKHYDELVYFIYTVRNSIRRNFYKQLQQKELDITFEMMEVLGALFSKNGRNQQEIADELNKNKASLTPLIDNLVIRKLVIRKTDENDKRSNLIFLTEDGENYREIILNILASFYEKLKQEFSPQEISSVVSILQKMDQYLNA